MLDDWTILLIWDDPDDYRFAVLELPLVIRRSHVFLISNFIFHETFLKESCNISVLTIDPFRSIFVLQTETSLGEAAAR
jgi:hypothetical protein